MHHLLPKAMVPSEVEHPTAPIKSNRHAFGASGPALILRAEPRHRGHCTFPRRALGNTLCTVDMKMSASKTSPVQEEP